MKFLNLNFLIFLLLSSNMALAYDAVFVFSPYQSPDSAKSQAKEVLKYLTEEKPGYEALLVDGYNIKVMGIYKNPESQSYISAKARLKKNGKTVKALMDFSATANMRYPEIAPRVHGALRIPQTLRFIAQNHSSEEDTDIILLGSPVYDAPRDHAFSMFDGLIPSDGHLVVSRSTSPFGTDGEAEMLQHLRIHFALPDDGKTQNNQYRFYLERFWTLYIERQDGSLISFTHDTQSVFSNVKSNRPAPVHNYTIDLNPKLEMIRFIMADLRNSIFFRPLSPYPVPRDQLKNVKSLVLALKWDCLCDLDLYARPFKSADILSIYNPETPQGRHIKQYVLSDEKEWGFELIAFDIPVDLAKLEIVVNNFGGMANREVKGELRLAINGKIFARSFKLAAKDYFSAHGVDEAFNAGHNDKPYIMRFDAAQIVTNPQPSL